MIRAVTCTNAYVLTANASSCSEQHTASKPIRARPGRPALSHHPNLLLAWRRPAGPLMSMVDSGGRSRRVFVAGSSGGSDCVAEHAPRKSGKPVVSRGSYLQASDRVVTDGSAKNREGIGLPKHAVSGMCSTVSRNRPWTFAGTSR